LIFTTDEKKKSEEERKKTEEKLKLAHEATQKMDEERRSKEVH
jgi:hypothetical protein